MKFLGAIYTHNNNLHIVMARLNGQYWGYNTVTGIRVALSDNELESLIKGV